MTDPATLLSLLDDIASPRNDLSVQELDALEQAKLAVHQVAKIREVIGKWITRHEDNGEPRHFAFEYLERIETVLRGEP